MYASRTTQFIVGLFALLGIAALAYLSLSLGRVEFLPAPSYNLYANFDTISGLQKNDPVEIAGVQIGRVVGLSLVDNRARVALRINQGVQIDDDAFASVKSVGIIGGKFVNIALGAGDRTLHNGDAIRHTQSAVVLEDLIGQLVGNAGSSGGSSGGSAGGAGKGAQQPGSDKQ